MKQNRKRGGGGGEEQKKRKKKKRKKRGHPGSNRGPLDLQSNALPLSYIPMETKCKTKSL